MPSQSRALEASFEPSDKLGIPSGSETIPALEDFDSFFEKLNNIGQVDWRAAHPANPERKASAMPASASAPKGTPSTKASGSKDPFAGLRSAVAQAKQAQRLGPTAASAASTQHKKRRTLPGAFRFVVSALVLFIVGMGIGWAALSLPTKLNGESTEAGPASAPATARTEGLIIEPKVALPAKSSNGSGDRAATIVPLTEVTPNLSKNDAAILKPVSTDDQNSASLANSKDSLAVDLAAAKVAKAVPVMPAEPEPTIGNQGIQTSDDLIAGRQIETKGNETSAPVRNPAEKMKPAKAPAPVATSTAATASLGQNLANQASGTEQLYAVQVGACRSTTCIENYRKLVTTHLPSNADRIRIIPVPADGSGMQRVRVAPLDKSEAQQLRTALIQADPRFSNAYVVEVHP